MNTNYNILINDLKINSYVSLKISNKEKTKNSYSAIDNVHIQIKIYDSSNLLYLYEATLEL